MSDTSTEQTSSRQEPKSQPIESIAANQGPLIDDNAVRAAIEKAVANDQDPMTIRTDELSQDPASNPPPQATEVPQKFLSPDGEADVEKIKASTRQLDEAIQKRDPVPQKTVDDYLKEYREKEKLFRSQTVPKQAPPPESVQGNVPVNDSPPQNFEEIVRRDYQADPLATTARLVDLIVKQRFEPIEERERIEATRANIQGLVQKDPRVLQPEIYAAINQKLSADPDLWKLKNPHKAAWLEVKEEMRLGDPVSGQAHPSRPSAPVLGGGTPPSTPSSSVAQNPRDVAANLGQLDLRDKKQEALGDEAVRRMLAGN
jgi:hypothetical protein